MNETTFYLKCKKGQFKKKYGSIQTRRSQKRQVVSHSLQSWKLKASCFSRCATSQGCGLLPIAPNFALNIYKNKCRSCSRPHMEIAVI